MITTKESAVIYVEENIIPSHKEKCLQLLSDIDYGELKNDKAKTIIPSMLVLMFNEFETMPPPLREIAIGIIGPVEVTQVLNRLCESIDKRSLWDKIDGLDLDKILAEEFVRGSIEKAHEAVKKTIEKELNNINKNESNN